MLALAALVVAVGIAGGAAADRGSAAPEPDYCYGADDCAPPIECEDGLDNDGDGKVDYPSDPGCYGHTDNEEDDGWEPQPPPPPTAKPQCSDGADNDRDGLSDRDDFTGCTSTSDNDEGNDDYLQPSAHGEQYYEVATGAGTGNSTNPCRPGSYGKKVGARRHRSGPVGSFWEMFQYVHFCYNPRTPAVTQILEWLYWWKTPGFPISVAYKVSTAWTTLRRPTAGARYTSATVQGHVTVAPRPKPNLVIFDDRPLVRFELYGDGSVRCGSDLGPLRGCSS
ncbi:MAG: hypothetical protein ABR521_11955 [Gaiellaceae bacterium]